MFHTWGNDNFTALLCDAIQDSTGSVSLKARSFYRPAENGALYLPQLTEAEARNLRAISGQLHWTDGGLKGQWMGQDDIARSIEFSPHPIGTPLVAEECNDWGEFKQWASQARLSLNAALYRGHGNRTFQLQTSLHRAGRCRIERYCAETLQQFHAQAEATLDMRLNMNDGGDYAVVLGLGQHHGLPTP
jgi:hypothetical protein